MTRFSRFGALLLAVAPLLAGCGEDAPAQTPAPPPDVKLSTIAEARTRKPGDYANVAGFVTVAPLTFSSATGDFGFAIQDDTGGIYVSILEPFTAPLDKKVRALGLLVDAEGQLVLESVVDYLEALPDPAMPVAPKEITTGEVGEPVEGMLVRTTGTVTKAAVDDKNGQYWYGVSASIDDGSGEVRVYVHINGTSKTPLVDTTKLVVGASVTITGFAQQYGTTYEVAPRRASDLVVN